MNCNICGKEFQPTRKAFFASQDTYALAEMINNLIFELHVLSHSIPIGANQ